jgi:hypothetical protein
MEPDETPLNPAVQQPAFKPPDINKPSNGQHSNRRSNHIVRRYREAEAIIPMPTRVARPVTLNTTPEQAKQAAIIASAAFQPLISVPKLPDIGPITDQVGGLALDAAQPELKQKNRAAKVLAIVFVSILLLAAAGGLGAYLATH